MWNKKEWAVFVISLFIIMLFTKTSIMSWNDGSRMAAIQSLVENHTFAIDDSQFVNQTEDKVFFSGHFHSDKPVMSYLIGVPIYWVLYNFGVGFHETPNLAYYLVTLLTIGLLASLTLVYFYRYLSYYKLESDNKLLNVALLGFGTLFFTYSVVFNNHLEAAAFLFFALYNQIRAKKPWHFVLAGFFAGIASSVDLVIGGIFLMLFAVMFLAKREFKNLKYFILGACIPISVHMLVNWLISGSVKPFVAQPDFFKYQNSRWPVPPAPLQISRAEYAYNIFFGNDAGFISYTPILLFSIAGLIINIIRNNHRKECVLILFGTVFTFMYYIFQVNNYDGCAFGYRYSVALVPVLFMFTPVAFQFKNRYLVLGLQILFVAAALFSIYHSFAGASNPWTCSYDLSYPKGPFSCGVTQLW